MKKYKGRGEISTKNSMQHFENPILSYDSHREPTRPPPPVHYSPSETLRFYDFTENHPSEIAKFLEDSFIESE
jgi:hypothetical protein